MRIYPQYKASGIEWIDLIPSHWEVAKLRWIADIYAGGTPRREISDYWYDGTIPWIASGEVNQVYITQPTTYITSEAFKNSSTKWIPEGALVMALAGQGKTKGMIAQLGIRTTCNQSLAAIVPKKVSPRYVFYWLQSNYKNIRGLVGDSQRDGLNLDIIASISQPVPTQDEQYAITNYLDQKTAVLDNIIAQKQRLIELLQEERTAVISTAVTQGLDPDAPRKPSGIPWLGKIPAHWDVKKLKYLVKKIGSGVTPSGGASVYTSSGILFVRSQNVHFSGLKLVDVTYIPEDIHENMSNSKVLFGDVLLNITGASIGRCCIFDQENKEANVNQHVCIIRPGNGILSKFLNYFLASDFGQTQIFMGQKGISREGLTFEELKSFMILLPNLEEQRHIVNFIDLKTDQIDQTIAQTENQITLLQEYRSILISHVVTGKIDVRQEVIL